MARTRRNIPFRHYWAATLDEAREMAEKHWSNRYFQYFYRAYVLHGTDAGNHAVGSKKYFKRAHRMGRRIEREQLRPHVALYKEFDDSAYRRQYKGTWWDVY